MRLLRETGHCGHNGVLLVCVSTMQRPTLVAPWWECLCVGGPAAAQRHGCVAWGPMVEVFVPACPLQRCSRFGLTCYRTCCVLGVLCVFRESKAVGNIVAGGMWLIHWRLYRVRDWLCLAWYLQMGLADRSQQPLSRQTAWQILSGPVQEYVESQKECAFPPWSCDCSIVFLFF